MQRAAAKNSAPALPRVVEHLPAISIAALTTMFVVAHLLPCDTSAAQWYNVAPIMLWVLLLIGWALAGVLRGRAYVVFDRTTLLVLLVTLLPGLSAAYLCVAESGNARLALNLAWQWASFGILFFLTRQWLKSAADVRMLAAIMIALAAGLAALALVQFAVLMPQSRLEYRQDPAAVIRKAGLDPSGNPTLLKHFEDRLNSTEPTATFSLTNSLAGLLAPWLVLAVGVATQSYLKTHGGGWRWLLPAALLVVALVLTKSRSAYLATLLGVGVNAIMATPLGRRVDWRIVALLAFACGVAVLGGIVSGALDVAVLSEAPKSVLYRLQYWQATAQMIRHFPVLGAGPGNFQDTYKWYQLPEASENIADPHNFVLEVWATAGTLGVIALAGLMTVFSWRIWSGPKLVMSADSAPLTAPWSAHLLAAAIGVLLGYGGGFLAQVMPDLALLYAAVPVAVVVLWLLRPWVLQGTLNVATVCVALAALLINLLAAGGISFPGVSTSVWLLIAMALTLLEVGEKIAGQPPAKPLPSVWRFACLGIAAALGVAYHTTVYNPVFRSTASQSEATLAERSGKLNEAIESATAAAQYDPWSPQFWMSGDPLAVDLSDLWFTRLTSDGDNQALRSEFVAACERAVQLDPRSEGTRTQLGHRWLALYRQWGRPDDLTAARDQYAAAVKCFPNNSLVHAQLAWVLHLAGDDPQAAKEAQIAWELDHRHEHGEFKLAKLRIYDVIPAAGRRQVPPPADVSAEQIVERLRKASNE